MRPAFLHPLLSLLMAATLSCERKDRAIRIGCVGPLTGTEAAIGQSCQSGYKLAADVWNARGGLLNRPIKLLPVDDKADAGLYILEPWPGAKAGMRVR